MSVVRKVRQLFIKTRVDSYDEFILISHDQRYLPKNPYKLSGKSKFLCRILIGTVVLVLGLLIGYIYWRFRSIDPLADEVTTNLPPSDSVQYEFSSAASVTNGVKCAQMATNILRKGGNAVDAAITALLCDGLSCPQSMGLGGGFLMTVYNRTQGKAYAINAREEAPRAATADMYHGNGKAAQTGALASGVPGELLGYWTIYQRFGGGVPWKDLFDEPIQMALTGIPVSPHLEKNIKLYTKYIDPSPMLRALFKDEKTNQGKKVGDTFTWPLLAKTLQIIANEGGNALHNGSLTEAFVKDIQDAGGIITVEDMKNYRVVVEEPITAKLNNGDTLYTSPLPGTGVLLSFMLQVLQYLIPAPSKLLWNQRFTEVMKYAYAYRGYLGDPNPDLQNNMTKSINAVVKKLQNPEFIQEIRNKISDTRTWQDFEHYNGKYEQSEDHGTANIVVYSAAGDAVVATSTVNLVFGSRFISPSTGIILNDEMDDFSSPNITNYFNIPPSPANFIQPSKRPLSSMCPTVVTDKDGNVKVAVGAAGGTKITTSVAQVIMANLWLNQTIKEAVDEARIHHQLYPMKYGYEYGVLRQIIEGMQKIGHVVTRLPNVFTSSITAISTYNTGGKVTGNADFRRPGGGDGF
uniref:Gamma-glutamyltranspeptidase 1 n=1 Tax=Cacopsylla melanoneura TaxID=428564 RepID=A0A8D8V6R5_9HEMI